MIIIGGFGASKRDVTNSSQLICIREFSGVYHVQTKLIHAETSNMSNWGFFFSKASFLSDNELFDRANFPYFL